MIQITYLRKEGSTKYYELNLAGLIFEIFVTKQDYKRGEFTACMDMLSFAQDNPRIIYMVLTEMKKRKYIKNVSL